MSILDWFKSAPTKDDDLDEWACHHNDPRSVEGSALWGDALSSPDLTSDELNELWRRANKLVGNRAPADYGEFCAYGYLQGRMDALNQASGRLA